MYGKICLITGATSGVGKATATRLADLGATVVMPARDASRGESAAAEIRARVPGARVEPLVADLSSLAQVRALSDDVLERHGRLDVLINNAGVITNRRLVTVDGFELTFAVNHLAPFLLTGLLRELLEHSAPARVVTVASAAHRQIRDIPWTAMPGGVPEAYPLSKLCNVLFTAELARRLAGTGVTANCLHPGFVRTAIGRDMTGLVGSWLRLVLRAAPSPETGARTPVHLASSPAVATATGHYYVKRRVQQPSALARDERAAARLWELSAALTGLDH